MRNTDHLCNKLKNWVYGVLGVTQTRNSFQLENIEVLIHEAIGSEYKTGTLKSSINIKESSYEIEILLKEKPITDNETTEDDGG